MPQAVYTVAQVEELLGAVAAQPDEGPFAVLVPQVGVEYEPDRTLMVVGRATNGWGELDAQFELAELQDQARRRHFAESTLRADSREPLYWVPKYGPTSPFWRVARTVAAGLGIAGEHWYRRVAWSNMYKVGPSAGGNPSDPLTDAQLDVCGRLLRREIEVLAPRRVLFLVGCGVEADWFKWFIEPLGFERVSSTRVQGHMVKRGQIGKSQVVVLPHPQGKPETVLAQAALRRFDVGCKKAR